MRTIVETLKELFIILLCEQLKIFTDHQKRTCKKFNTDHVLWRRIILGGYSPYIEYIPVEKNKVAAALSLLPNNGNQKTTHESTYTTETMFGSLKHR